LGVGARLGYIATPNLLTYINGGWTQTRFDQINLTVFESSAPSGAFVRRQLTMAGSSVAALRPR
jgi:hypothetical protein